MFWCFSHWNPNRIKFKLLSFILMIWGNHGRRSRAVCTFCLFSLRTRVWFLPESLCACLNVCMRYRVCGSHTFLPLCNSFDLMADSEMPSKWPAATFPTRPVVPHSLSSTSKPTHPSTYYQKKIQWFIISSRLLHRVKTWKIKDKKGLAETPFQYILHSFPFPSFFLFLTE